MTAARTFDVAIVGYGPVGAMLALLLQQAGVSVVMFERDAGECRYPKAAHFDDEVIRILQSVDLAHLIEEMTPPTRFEFFDRNWRKFLSRRFPAGVSDQSFGHDYMFFQPDVERAMRAALGSHPNAPDILLGYEVAALDQDQDGVTMTASSLSDGSSESYRARYVVGCDGARSVVRKTMGTAFEARAESHPWFVVDVKLTTEADPGWDQWEYCNPDRIVTYIPLSGPYRRFEFDVQPGNDPATLASPRRTWELLGPWLQPHQAEILRSDVYRFHSLLARSWRDRRLFIAGDAAHLMTPKAGQGLCTGMRDASNLAWKLVRVLRRQAPDSLLDSYETERKPAAAEYVDLSAFLTAQIMLAARRTDSELATDAEEIMVPRQTYGDAASRSVDALAGTLSRQPLLADGSRMDDAVGVRFALIATPEILAALTQAQRDQIAALDAHVLPADEAGLAAYLGGIGRQALLVRPDRYVAGSAISVAEVPAMLAAATGAFAAAPIGPGGLAPERQRVMQQVS